jgi:uroporphyrin-III C-methyltransferase/precorrin-2 dehydrogenase/sirohydrochlorin ferrochelatase
MHSLPLFLRLTGRTVILLGDGAAAEAKRRLLTRAGAQISADPHAAGAVLAIVALDGDAADAAATALKARGLLVNVVDRPDLCDFTTPAIVDRDPVIIAIGTGGASAGLAKALRQRLEGLLPPGLGGIARGLFAARPAIRAQWPDAGDRRRAIDAALMPGAPLDPMGNAGEVDVATWAASGPLMGDPIRVERITLTSADPDDLTLRAARLLGQADVIRHDGDVPDTILARARADAEHQVGADASFALVPGLTVFLDMPQ